MQRWTPAPAQRRLSQADLPCQASFGSKREGGTPVQAREGSRPRQQPEHCLKNNTEFEDESNVNDKPNDDGAIITGVKTHHEVKNLRDNGAVFTESVNPSPRTGAKDNPPRSQETPRDDGVEIVTTHNRQTHANNKSCAHQQIHQKAITMGNTTEQNKKAKMQLDATMDHASNLQNVNTTLRKPSFLTRCWQPTKIRRDKT